MGRPSEYWPFSKLATLLDEHPALLTFLTHQILTIHADLVLADKLIPQGALAVIPSPTKTELIIAKKLPGNADKSQEMMHLAVEGGRNGLCVVCMFFLSEHLSCHELTPTEVKQAIPLCTTTTPLRGCFSSVREGSSPSWFQVSPWANVQWFALTHRGVAESSVGRVQTRGFRGLLLRFWVFLR